MFSLLVITATFANTVKTTEEPEGQLPTVSITQITTGSGIVCVHSLVSDYGSSPVFEKGVRCIPVANPNNGEEIDYDPSYYGEYDQFNMMLTGLEIGKTYIISAYAINDYGTTYSAEVTVTVAR